MGYFVYYSPVNLRTLQTLSAKTASWVLKFDYCDVVYGPLPKCLVKRLQQVQYAAAAFVVCR